MDPNQTAAFKDLEQAQQALKAGDKNTARQLAAQAAQLAPELEEVWLMMGALASARGSVEYLERALQINPQSERAKKGLQWAQMRLQKEAEAAVLAPPSMPEKAPVVIESAPASQPQEEEKKPEPAVVVIPAIPVTQESKAEPESRPAAPAAMEPKTQPRAAVPVPVSTLTEAEQQTAETRPVIVAKQVDDGKAAAGPRYPYLILLVILLCLLVSWFAWRGITPVAAFLSSNAFTSAEHGPAWAEVNLAPANGATQAAPENTSVPSNAAGISATATNTPEPAASSTPTSAETALSASGDTQLTPTQTIPAPTHTIPAPTQTVPAPTQTNPAPSATLGDPTNTSPAPSNTLAPGPSATPLANLTQSPEIAEAPSPTPLPTDTAEPYPTQYVPATPLPGVASSGDGGRWIDVDLTHQMVYAFEGNTLVNSFVVSTGTWQHPTVTGQYRVYVKFRYKDMSGPGYYLPNVPFTMFFYQGYAIHGTYWHSNFGTPMSHGCVNLSIPDSEWVYNWASVGTLVNVHY